MPWLPGAVVVTLVFTSSLLGQTPGSPSSAAPQLKLPAQIQAQPGQPFSVVAETNLKWRRWKIPSGLTRVPPELTSAGENGFVGYGPAGVYEFVLEGTYQDQYAQAKCIVFVGQPQPIPPTPNPAPDSGLAIELQRLYDADKDPLKDGYRVKLAGLWQGGIEEVVGNDRYATIKNFTDAMHEQSQTFRFKLPATALRTIRNKMSEELMIACGGNANCPLGDAGSEVRRKVAAVLEKFVNALGSVK